MELIKKVMKVFYRIIYVVFYFGRYLMLIMAIGAGGCLIADIKRALIAIPLIFLFLAVCGAVWILGEQLMKRIRPKGFMNWADY